ncbi:hypothetical protein LCGC14_0898830 [marine sediment metagenome]|uniref:Uncharacterized protein n=1 Tax=marine sediment metagenome TaxID=412755 RepID=A0A0F9P1W9_9ZZZZ
MTTKQDKRVRRFFFWFFLGAFIGLVILVGCEALDRTVRDVNDWAAVGGDVLRSPPGRALPPDIRLYGSLAVSLLMGGAAAYEKWRLSQMSKTTKAIVRGIEQAESAGPDNPKLPVKTAIAAEMRKLGIFDIGNKLVDRFKTS